MTTRNKRKLAALNRENCEEHPRSNLAQNSSAPRSQEDYITQVSEEIEGRVTKRLSKEFSRTENRILGALARLDDFLMNPLLPGYSGATPEPTRRASGNNQGTNEDDSQNDPHPEADHTIGPDINYFITKKQQLIVDQQSKPTLNLLNGKCLHLNSVQNVSWDNHAYHEDCPCIFCLNFIRLSHIQLLTY